MKSTSNSPSLTTDRGIDSDTISELERALRLAGANTGSWRPWIASEREAIVAAARECLGLRDEWVPSIRAEPAAESSLGSIVVQHLRSESWRGCLGAAHLFMPRDTAPAPRPLVLLCCGHARDGKRGQGYQDMAWRLAHMGCAVLVPDNLGQGERNPMGHRDVLMPFACGLSLQGLIVMETAAWIDWALADGRFDATRIAAIGNSGGGTLTTFLGAIFGDRLCALSSSGYPCRFDYIALKEKKHCHCNILPGIVGRLEMWQLYGGFAPKPLFLFQGRNDPLFPEDIFHSVRRKVHHAYEQAGAADACRTAVFDGGHSWDTQRIEAMAVFIGQVMNLDPAAKPPHPLTEPFDRCHETWPDDALDTDTLACRLAGRRPAGIHELSDVYLPGLESRGEVRLPRVGGRQLAAQMTAFLAPEFRPDLPRRPSSAGARASETDTAPRRIPMIKLREIARRLLIAARAGDAEAAIVAEELVETSLMGIDSHGIIRIPQYTKQLRDGSLRPNVTPRIVQRKDGTLIVDGGNGFGMITARFMTDAVAELAQTRHLAAAVSRHTHHVGRLGSFVQRLAERGLFGLAVANSSRQGHYVAPWGGTQGRLGTNPLAYGCPTNGRPLVLDMSTSAIAEGAVRACLQSGRLVPEGCLLTPEGQPTTDPNEFYRGSWGSILPFGGRQGYKGFGLSLLVELLGNTLAGAEVTSEDAKDAYINGFFILAIHPDAFCGQAEFIRRVEELCDDLRSSPPREDGHGIVLPGERDFETRDRRLEQGIPLHEGTWRELVKTGESLGVPVNTILENA